MEDLCTLWKTKMHTTSSIIPCSFEYAKKHLLYNNIHKCLHAALLLVNIYYPIKLTYTTYITTVWYIRR